MHKRNKDFFEQRDTNVWEDHHSDIYWSLQ